MPKKYVPEEQSIEPKLDPALQQLIANERAGIELDPSIAATDSVGKRTVEVLAKLADTTIAVPGLDVTRTIGDIVTATVSVGDIETVRKHANVRSLKAAKKISPALDFSVGEIGCSDLGKRFPQHAVNGRGVLVGVVDYGCDFVHQNFRTDAGTRLVALWDQRDEALAVSPAGFNYGREYTAASINAALSAPEPYTALGYRPSIRAHGTHVMDIAAGNGRATGLPGVAPEADLLFVHLSANDFADEEAFGNSKRLLDAVDYIFTKAAERGQPCVVNLSLGTHGGPHDGTSLVEQGLDTLLKTPGRAIVVAAGNSWKHAGHAAGQIANGAARTLGWEISSSDNTTNELEIWYPKGTTLGVTLIAPDQSRLGPVGPDKNIAFKDGQTVVARVIHRLDDPNNGDNHIDVFLTVDAPKGQWGIELSTTDAAPVAFHAWIERDDHLSNVQSRFAAPDVDVASTLGSISCGKETIAVGAYIARTPGRDVAAFSAEGPTRDGRPKPELSAPGQGVRAAASLTQSSRIDSGTSMAAPHVTGLAALYLQSRTPTPTAAEIRRALIETARKAGEEWHPRLGVGRIDGTACLESVLGTAAPVSAPPEEVPVPVPRPKSRPRSFAGTLPLFGAIVAVILIGSVGETLYQGWYSWLVVAFSLTMFAFALGHFAHGRTFGILISDQNRFSLSRLQLVLWTLLIISAFLVIAFWRITLRYPNPLQFGFPNELWALLGISGGSFVGSALILHQKEAKEATETAEERFQEHQASTGLVGNTGLLAERASPKEARFLDMFIGDEKGNADSIDLTKVQLFFFTIAAVLAYGAAIYATLAVDPSRGSLPTLDPSLVTIIGISHAGYLTFKAVDHTQTKN